MVACLVSRAPSARGIFKGNSPTYGSAHWRSPRIRTRSAGCVTHGYPFGARPWMPTLIDTLRVSLCRAREPTPSLRSRAPSARRIFKGNPPTCGSAQRRLPRIRTRSTGCVTHGYLFGARPWMPTLIDTLRVSLCRAREPTPSLRSRALSARRVSKEIPQLVAAHSGAYLAFAPSAGSVTFLSCFWPMAKDAAFLSA